MGESDEWTKELTYFSCFLWHKSGQKNESGVEVQKPQI